MKRPDELAPHPVESCAAQAVVGLFYVTKAYFKIAVFIADF
jgi:hypothetical protein